ncbi:MAG: DUF2752 domain-containing protein [Bdellovibrionaceae bacterium]|nr:DUF2752 domain-containing protein [Pseudobdellovibrionaceae bacterium]
MLFRFYMGEISPLQIQNGASRLYIPCIFHWLTELDCPGCGITRSLMALYLWSPQWSFYFHPLGPILGLLSFFYWLSFGFEFIEKICCAGQAFFNRHSMSFLLVILAWGIFRNF